LLIASTSLASTPPRSYMLPV